MQPPSVTLRVPDFRDAESGIEFTEIEVIIQMESDLNETVKLVDALQRPLTERQ